MRNLAFFFLVCCHLSGSCIAADLDLSVDSQQLPLALTKTPSSKRVINVRPERFRLEVNNGSGNETTIDLGTVPASTATFVNLTVQNTGKDQLKLIAAESSCGCFGALTKDLVLETGDEGSLMLKILAPPSSEDFGKKLGLRFATSSGKEIRSEVVIQGESLQIASLQTANFDLSKSKGVSTVRKRLVLKRNFPEIDLRHFRISITDALIDGWSVVQKHDAVVELEISMADPDTIPVEQWNEYVSLANEDFSFEIPIAFSVREKFYAKPRNLMLTPTELPYSARIVVASADKQQEVSLVGSTLLCNNTPLEGCHEVTNSLSAGHISAFRISIKRLPRSAFEGTAEIQLKLDIKDSGKPIVLPISIALNGDEEK